MEVEGSSLTFPLRLFERPATLGLLGRDLTGFELLDGDCWDAIEFDLPRLFVRCIVGLGFLDGALPELLERNPLGLDSTDENA